MNKVWLALHTLRAKISQIISPDVATNSKISQGDTLWFPDPLPPSASATTRSLRSVRMSTNTVNVFHSSQMIPVLISLIHTALETSIIREELEQGAKNNKEYARGAKEAIRIENERWEKEKKIIEVGSKDKAQKAEAGFFVVIMLSGSCFAPDPCQTLCAQEPVNQHRECIEDNWAKFCTTIYDSRY